ncbi:cilia- and flagella-associated protein 52-like [Asterias rubens]|uniref:cilia- and flagella-associated protein 52-like n=1 Tax=Asterias rubens TaxID=7604 RepID=UPI0014558EF8|nr:cilia- and flagella-associated protein 52-like [Asterias rubens]
MSQQQNGDNAVLSKLELISMTGFNGEVFAGFKVHPDKEHIIYPVGNTVIVEHITKNTQNCLSGHTNDVSCIAVSKDGKYIASGQVTYMGFKADVIIWDFKEKELYCRLDLHKVKVQSLAFSPSSRYLVSLGGQDDGSVVVWDVAKKQSVCGSPAAVMSAGMTSCIAYCNNDDHQFVTAGERTIRVWTLDVANRKIRPVDCNMGQLKRYVKCIEVSNDDKYFYCGTTSGDVLQINVSSKLLGMYGPEKDKYSQGVTSLALLWTGEILVGAGDGTVALVKGDKFKKIRHRKLAGCGTISSIALRGAGHQFLVGTGKSKIYRFNLADFENEIMRDCHYSSVEDIAFPYGFSDLFATCSQNDIRVWNAKNCKDLLSITVPNMTCHAIEFTRDGRSIVSAWDDNKIRVFYPESGKLMYQINDAHNKKVTAITTTSDCSRIISGGGEGQVRVWVISNMKATLKEAMKEHKAAVTCIVVKKNDSECISASDDGSCIIWDLNRFTRSVVIFASTLFKCVCYNQEESQAITSGTDRKIGYWEAFNASQIREVDGSKTGAVNGMMVSPDGQHFVTCGDDKLIKVWNYEEGSVTHVGIGHSGEVNKLRICPNQKTIVSVSKDGAILCWKYPHGSTDNY